VTPEAAIPLYVRDKVAYTSAERAAGQGGNPRAVVSSAAVPTIAAMTTADLAEVVALGASVQQHPWTHGNFADALAAGYDAWVLRDGHEPDRLLGMAVLMRAPDVAHVLTIAVARAAQGRGYGRRLLEQCEAQARRHQVVGLLLEVRVSNTVARAFYARASFVQIGVRRGYYLVADGQGSEDALVLQKILSATGDKSETKEHMV